MSGSANGDIQSENMGKVVDERPKLDVMEDKCLQGMWGLTRKERFGNLEVMHRAVVRENMIDRADQNAYKLFEHLKLVKAERLTEKVY